MDEEKHTEQIQMLRVSDLVPFPIHPFKVLDDEAMLRTTESIATYGILSPLIVRPAEDGKYEIVSGHRRVHAAEAVGLEEVPAIVRNMDDDVAKILVVDSNLHREKILPSERAFAYKMKNEAMKRMAGRPIKENDGQVGHNYVGKRTVDILGDQLDKNSGAELPIRCKVYSGLSEKDEARLFASQTGYSVAPGIGMKLRALVFAGDPEACSFLKHTEEIGLKIDYGQHKGRKRIACIAAALTEFRKLGPEKYQAAMKMIVDGWDGDPDSLRAETVTGVCRFVDLYYGEYDPKRAVRRFRTVDPLKIYRDGKAMGDNLPGYKKYLYQVLQIYNGASKKAALPMKF